MKISLSIISITHCNRELYIHITLHVNILCAEEEYEPFPGVTVRNYDSEKHSERARRKHFQITLFS